MSSAEFGPEQSDRSTEIERSVNDQYRSIETICKFLVDGIPPTAIQNVHRMDFITSAEYDDETISIELMNEYIHGIEGGSSPSDKPNTSVSLTVPGYDTLAKIQFNFDGSVDFNHRDVHKDEEDDSIIFIGQQIVLAIDEIRENYPEELEAKTEAEKNALELLEEYGLHLWMNITKRDTVTTTEDYNKSLVPFKKSPVKLKQLQKDINERAVTKIVTTDEVFRLGSKFAHIYVKNWLDSGTNNSIYKHPGLSIEWMVNYGILCFRQNTDGSVQLQDFAGSELDIDDELKKYYLNNLERFLYSAL